MDVTPQLLHDAEFREAKRGGYNTQDVDEFLERLAVGIDRQTAQLKEARARIEAAESRIADAERRAAQAELRASQVADSDETLKRTLVLAQRTADAAIKEAQDEAARLLAEAREASARAQADAEAEAERAHRDARARVLAEMRDLEALRDQLHGDVQLLEQHLDDQRQHLHHSVEVLQALLQDPRALQASPEPALSEAVAPVEEAPSWPEEQPFQEPRFEEHAYEEQPFAEAEPAPAASDWEPDDGGWDAAPAADQPQPEAHHDEGPPTQAVDVLADRDGASDTDDDAYLTELRKAMTDQSPLGPRDDGMSAMFAEEPEPARSRFGRRR